MFESKINRGRANGYAPLDGSGKVPLDKLPPIQSTINTGSLATTGSNTFTGTQTFTGSRDTTLTIQASNTFGGNTFDFRATGSEGTIINILSNGISYFGASTTKDFVGDASAFSNALNGEPFSDGPTAGIAVQKSGSFQSAWVFDYDGKSYFPGDINIGYGITGSGIVYSGSLNIATGSLNIRNGNINVSGSLNISSSLVVSSTIVNNGNIEALNSDLVIDGGDIYLTGSLLMTGSITLNGVTYTSLTGSGGTGGESGTSGTSGESGTSGTSGESGTSGTSGTSILLDSTLTFEGNIISGSSVETVGTQITIAQDYYGGTGLNGSGLIVADNAETSGVQNGWIIRFYDGTIRTVIGNSVPFGESFRAIAFGSTVSLNPAYPLTIESPDYQLGSDASVELKVGEHSIVLGDDGILKLNNGLGEIYADAANGSVRIGTAAENVAPNSQIILGVGNEVLKIKSGPPLREWTFGENGDFNLTGSINGARNLVTTASFNSFTASQFGLNVALNDGINFLFDTKLNTSSFNTYTASVVSVNTGSLVTTSSFNTLTSSFNTFSASVNTTTASLNSKTGSYATTGSNQFNGNQSITGSLFVSSTAISNATLLASSSNLTLNSGSNLYVQNNGLVEITGSLNITGSVTINQSRVDNAWTAYTPVWTAASSNPAINNGTIEGYYKVIGKTCFVRGNIAMGSTTTFGSGEWYVSMPFTASHADAILMSATLLDNGTAWYNATMLGARAGFNSRASIQYQTVGGTAGDVNATAPFTWTTSDRFVWNGSYEIA
jgi:hypothetical protein